MIWPQKILGITHLLGKYVRKISEKLTLQTFLVTVLDRHAPRKTKILRGNQKPHVDKNLRKAIMKRSKLKSKANRTKPPKDISDYKKQRNLVVR